MTPIHDGSRTPAHWESSVANTPARQSDVDGYELDNYNSSNVEYAPQTPGSNYASSDHSFSPYHTASPSGYHSSSASSYLHTPSPGGSGIGPYGTASPISYSPMTPGSASSVSMSSPYNNPQTPGAGK